jgi:hypothetical protein
MIICGFKDQLTLLLSLKSFEIDMSYKRVKESGLNEVIFATFLPDHGKSRCLLIIYKVFTNYLLVITLLQIFTNQDTTEGYYLLFKRSFQMIEKVTGNRCSFRPLHGTGIYGIIMDMCNKQMTGKYLLTSY